MILQQVSFASGDMFSIAAAMLFRPDLKVVIYLQKQDEDEEPDLQFRKAVSVIRFYDEVIGDPKRYTIAEKTLGKTKPQERALEIEKVISELWPDDKDFNHKEDAATAIVGAWREEYRKVFRKAMSIRLDSSLLFAIEKWLQRRGFEGHHGKRVAVLWSRLSGKKGEIHIEHDTSYYGMFQLCLTALQNNDLVIITGDPPYDPLGKSPHRKSRFEDIATVVNFLHSQGRLATYPSLAECWAANSDLLGPPPVDEKPSFFELATRLQERTATLPKKAVNLTGFWEGPDALRDSWTPTRASQFRLYEYLRRTCSVVKHLGFRSGNLEALALLGYTVRYMEEPFSVGANRMTLWHGKGIGYERIVVSQVPTRSGQHLSIERQRAVQGTHLTLMEKHAKASDDFANNEKLRNQPMAKLERVIRLLEVLLDAGHPRETWTYLLATYDVVEALKVGLVGPQLPPEAHLPFSVGESPYVNELAELDTLLNHATKGLRRDNVATLLAKAPLTNVRRDLEYLARLQLGPVILPRQLKRVDWSPAQLARRQKLARDDFKGSERSESASSSSSSASAKPDVRGLTQGFLTRDLGVIRAYLDTAPPDPFFI